MKLKLLIKSLGFFAFPLIAFAQDSVTTIQPLMFDKERDQCVLSEINGWIFKQGTDTTWARKDIDVTGWKKLRPTELSKSYADKTGRVEGWFRIKIKIDTSFKSEVFGLKGSSWAATDFYIDGILVESLGNTGGNGKPYHEHNPYGDPAVPVDLKAGNEYTIAVHFVDYRAPLLTDRLKSEFVGLNYVIRLTGTRYNKLFLQKAVKEVIFYHVVWLSICVILSLLLWLLYFQNSREKNLLLIALCSGFIALAEVCQYNVGVNARMSFAAYMVYNFMFNLFAALLCVLIPIILARVFNRRVSKGLKYFLGTFFISFMAAFFIPDKIANPIYVVLFGSILAVGIYYISVSWKNLKGAQWAIVAGTLLSIAWTIIYFLVGMVQVQSNTVYFLLASAYTLSFPLSLLIYVSLRFREIVNDVRANAQQVIQLSEEKKQQALNQQKILEEEVAIRTADLRKTLDDLKSTQAQLVQSEKMASLGEMTAGIAHEIQNPLNFVNNFSEVNTELVNELKREIATNNQQQAMDIADNIKDNEEKINFHGKRADAIVKSMLMHSRASSGKKEPTDINALCDEYLRLAYHGLRAKEKDFNAKFETDFDPTVGKINVVPQDIGRVLLNLVNNAFYAVSEKKKRGDSNYEPTVTVKTVSIQGSRDVEITVTDNGDGIPQKNLDKIFQPFFTTKPTGQGTGLGLSLSYDIIKAHGGEMKVESKEAEGTVFTIRLPNS